MENINDEQPRIRNLYSLVPRYIGKIKIIIQNELRMRCSNKFIFLK